MKKKKEKEKAQAGRKVADSQTLQAFEPSSFGIQCINTYWHDPRLTQKNG